jgi:hypothetical protein
VLPSSPGSGSRWQSPRRKNSVVGSFALEDVGKAAGANSMMRELGGASGSRPRSSPRRQLRLGRRLPRRVRAGDRRRRGALARRRDRRPRPAGPPASGRDRPPLARFRNRSAGLDPLRSPGREPRVEAGGAGVIAGVKLKVNHWAGALRGHLTIGPARRPKSIAGAMDTARLTGLVLVGDGSRLHSPDEGPARLARGCPRRR